MRRPDKLSLIGGRHTLAIVSAALVISFLAGRASSQDALSPADQYESIVHTLFSNLTDQKLTGDPDVDYLALTMPLYAAEIDLAQIEIRFGKNPKVRNLAKNVLQIHQTTVAATVELLSEGNKQ
jgi:uncharacterized protein (DUF305 family)